MKCAICVIFFWALAAVLLLASHHWLEPISPALDGVAKVGVLCAAGFAYMRAMRGATLEHALLVGATWVILAVIIEVVRASAVGHGWHELIGAPEHPVIRAALLIAWVGAPALFVRTRSWQGAL